LQDGDRFWRMPEIYIRGNTLKYIRVPEEVRQQQQQRH
jgi:U6 snRNA-associated Sm-like protein LSm4